MPKFDPNEYFDPSLDAEDSAPSYPPSNWKKPAELEGNELELIRGRVSAAYSYNRGVRSSEKDTTQLYLDFHFVKDPKQVVYTVSFADYTGVYKMLNGHEEEITSDDPMTDVVIIKAGKSWRLFSTDDCEPSGNSMHPLKLRNPGYEKAEEIPF